MSIIKSRDKFPRFQLAACGKKYPIVMARNRNNIKGSGSNFLIFKI